jgi:putative SOS response-associated peptidase YedK
MVGRYDSPDTVSIQRTWNVRNPGSCQFSRRFHILPATTIPVLRANSAPGDLTLLAARWGFVPSSWRQKTPPEHCFNARAEEAGAKTLWRHAYLHSRCLIPAEGWYDWSGVQRVNARTGKIENHRQPHFIRRRDGRLICFAGLMSLWEVDGRLPQITCAILTRAAAPSVADVNDRMPWVVREEAFGTWLEPKRNTAEAVALLLRYFQDDFEHHRISAASLEPA